MNKLIIHRVLILLVLFFGTVTASSAADSFYMKKVNVEPGTTATLEFVLDNTTVYYGFQTDISLPLGLEFVTNGVGNANISLSERANNTFNIVSNLSSGNRSLRLGAFSSAHDSFSGSSGVLLYAEVKASDNFSGGNVSIANSRFVNKDDHDQSLADSSTEVTAKYLVKAITLAPASAEVGIGATLTLTATFLPENATDKSVTWTSSNTSVATVDASGKMTGVKAGTAVITATATDGSGVKGECTVTVVKVPDTLTMIFGKTQLKQGESTTLSISFDESENFSYSGLQFDVTLPDGMIVEKSTFNSELVSHIATCNADNNPIKYIITATNVEGLKVISDLVQLTIKAEETMAVGNAEIKITDIKLSSSVGDYKLSDVASAIEILNKNIPVTAIELAPSTLDIYKGDSYCKTVTATITPSDATNQDLEWIVKDNSILSLNITGNKATITGKNFGTTTITVQAKDGSGISSTITVNVVPIPANSITLEGTSVTTLKEREENQLTAKVSPADTTYPEVQWTSSDEKVATVDATGLVTAVGAGKAVITATVKATPTVKATYNLTVEKLLLGDSNEDQEVDVFDVVNIANYIVGKNPYPFCFVASDVIYDKQINVADQNATVRLAIGLPIEEPAKVATRLPKADNGRLTAGDIISMSDRKVTIPISLSSDNGYSSLQADVILPEGMEIEAVSLTPFVDSHSLTYNVTADGSLKLVVYSFDNSILPVNDNPIFEIVIDTNGKNGVINMENIFASTPDCSLFSLQFGGCEINGDASIDSFINDNIIVRGVNGAIEVINSDGKACCVFDMEGRLMASLIPSTSNEVISVTQGFYIVVVDNVRFKVSVK